MLRADTLPEDLLAVSRPVSPSLLDIRGPGAQSPERLARFATPRSQRQGAFVAFAKPSVSKRQGKAPNSRQRAMRTEWAGNFATDPWTREARTDLKSPATVALLKCGATVRRNAWLERLGSEGRLTGPTSSQASENQRGSCTTLRQARRQTVCWPQLRCRMLPSSSRAGPRPARNRESPPSAVMTARGTWNHLFRGVPWMMCLLIHRQRHELARST